VFLGLGEAGYQVIQQYMVGECVIDLVVEDDENNRIAIQCDGDREQTMEAVEEEMARHQMLRRLGWDFIRVRGSEFFRNRDKGLKKLQRRLQEVGFAPAGPGEDSKPKKQAIRAGEAEESLLKRVIKRAELIRSRWKDIPTPSAARKAAAGGQQSKAEENKKTQSATTA